MSWFEYWGVGWALFALMPAFAIGLGAVFGGKLTDWRRRLQAPRLHGVVPQSATRCDALDCRRAHYLPSSGVTYVGPPSEHRISGTRVIDGSGHEVPTRRFGNVRLVVETNGRYVGVVRK